MDVIIDGVRFVEARQPSGVPGLLDFVWSFEDAGGQMPIRDYLRAILTRIWDEGEAFSGKRPFGNSGWEYDILSALIAAKAVDGDLDEDGRYESMSGENLKKANAIVFGLINEMCEAK